MGAGEVVLVLVVVGGVYLGGLVTGFLVGLWAVSRQIDWSGGL